MNEREIAYKALDRLLYAMEGEATTPTWAKADDHPQGGYDLYSCSIAPVIHWLWFKPPFYSSGGSRETGGLLASEFRSLSGRDFDDVMTLFRYLHSVKESYRDTLISLEGEGGMRIVSGLKANNWMPK